MAVVGLFVTYLIKNVSLVSNILERSLYFSHEKKYGRVNELNLIFSNVITLTSSELQDEKPITRGFRKKVKSTPLSTNLL